MSLTTSLALILKQNGVKENYAKADPYSQQVLKSLPPIFLLLRTKWSWTWMIRKILLV